MNIKPTYYAILPADVRYDKDLIPNAKLLYAEITVLTQANGVCWASDNYFMDLYGVKRQTVQRWLKMLEDKGYIKREVVYKEGTKEIERRYIRVCTKKRQGYTQKSDKGIHNKVTGNTTSTNTTSINSNKYDQTPFFNDFWEIYPKKVGKGTALNSFKRKVKNEETFNLIKQDLEKRKGYEEWLKKNGKFIPHPSTYLNQERWLDEYEISNQRKPFDQVEDQVVNYDFVDYKPKD